jgi:hypothetical protein
MLDKSPSSSSQRVMFEIYGESDHNRRFFVITDIYTASKYSWASKSGNKSGMP